MGKLVLTQRAGESVKLVEANGKEWLLEVIPMKHIGPKWTFLSLNNERKILAIGDSIHFAGGSLELRPSKRRWPDQAVLAFDSRGM